MSNINHYNFLQYNEKSKQDKNIKTNNKNINNAVVKINPANLNNYQQIIKNDQMNQKLHEFEAPTRNNNHQNNNGNIKTNFFSNFNQNYINNCINNFTGANINNQVNKMKNTILKIKSDDQKENVYKINLRQDHSADRVIEPQRQIITADMITKKRNDLNRSVNLKTTRPQQLYSATNRNTILLNNNFNQYNRNLNDNKTKEKDNNRINNKLKNCGNPTNFMTINNKNTNNIFTPIHAQINLNYNSNNNHVNQNNNTIENKNIKISTENRVFSPLLDKYGMGNNQSFKRDGNPLNGNQKQILENNHINNNVNVSVSNNIFKNNLSHIKQVIQSNNCTSNTTTPNNKDKSQFSYREKDKKELNDNKNINFNIFDPKITFINGKNAFNLNDNTNLETKKCDDVINLFNSSAKSVKEYSYTENRNSSFRNTMEDYCKIIDRYMNDNSKGLFCLYDGHGGSEPVKYVSNRMPDIFSKCLMETKNNIEKSLISTFQKVDDELKVLSDCENIGTTACLVYIFKDADIITGGRKTIYCANVGDTRCILLQNSTFKRMSYDHKCTDETEVSRIRKVGGVVFNGRVFGQLALSRALGDHAMKKYGVICTPYINRHIVSEKDRFIVVCSDGVWDVLSDEEVFNLSQKVKRADELSLLIVNNAVDKGSRDNISCIVVRLN